MIDRISEMFVNHEFISTDSPARLLGPSAVFRRGLATAQRVPHKKNATTDQQAIRNVEIRPGVTLVLKQNPVTHVWQVLSAVAGYFPHT